jgi:hypothetical protein
MIINKHNLSIAEHCADKPIQGYATDVLHVTENGTLAVNRVYQIVRT